ncbi:MAG: HEAT repeat domain-containing protein [Anaerolineales bacterium]|nr:HEAT repeat domain-containing protein [Anaerolineales bacterium]
MNPEDPPLPETVENPRAVSSLLKRMEFGRDTRSESAAGIRCRAVKELAETRDRRAVPALIRALEDPDLYVCMTAATKLGEIGDRRAVRPLLKALRRPAQWEELRSAAGENLGRIGDERIVPVLVKLLNHKDVFIVDGAIIGLAVIGGPGLAPLVRALQHRNPQVRARAAMELGYCSDPCILEGLLSLLSDGSAKVRFRSAQALGEIGDGRAREPLRKATADPDPDVRATAVRALGCLEGTDAREAMGTFAGSQDPGIRRAAFEALWLIDGMTRALIRKALTDPDPGVRWMTGRAIQTGFPPIPAMRDRPLPKISWRPETRAEEIDFWIATEQWERCACAGPEALDPILEAFPQCESCDPDPARSVLRLLQENAVPWEQRRKAVHWLRGEPAGGKRRRMMDLSAGGMRDGGADLPGTF